jgi:phosphotransferase system enzyme I (PtsI)
VEREGMSPLVEPALGIMIEVPSTALMAEQFLAAVDFGSIGTNDLIQYTLAVDRGNQMVSHLYSPYNPAVLKLIDMTAKAGVATGREVNVCGEMASDPVAAVLMIGMGITTLSMEPRHLLTIKGVVTSISKKEATQAAGEALSMQTAKQVEELIMTRFDLPKAD